MIFCTLPDFREKSTIIYTNLLIGVFNLLPIYPLDGARAIEGMLKCFLPCKEVDEVIHKVSNVSLVILSVIGIVGMVYSKNIAIPAIFVYLWIMVAVENKKYRLKARVYEVIEGDRVIR